MRAEAHAFLLPAGIWRRRCETIFDRLLRDPQRDEAR